MTRANRWGWIASLVALTAVVMLRWRVSSLWLVGAGMTVGALGWV